MSIRDNKRLICILMLTSLIYFIISVSIAMIVYPSYGFLTQFLSALGVGSHGWIFNLSLVFLGITTIPFFITALKNTLWNNSFISISHYLGSFSGLLLIGIGVFVSAGKSSTLHNIFAILYFLTIMVECGLFSIGVWYDNRFLSIMLMYVAIITLIGLFLPVNQYLFQKLIVFSYIIILIYYVLYLRKNNLC